MLAKKFRLSQREVKKVLHKGKPFFSYTIVFNVSPSKLPYNRFAIVIGKKSVVNNVQRNFFRRRFYDLCQKQQGYFGDVVCVVKTKSRLSMDDQSCKAFMSEISYLFDKKLGKNT